MWARGRREIAAAATTQGLSGPRKTFPGCVSKYGQPGGPASRQDCLRMYIYVWCSATRAPCFARNTKQVPHGASCDTDWVSNLTNSNAWPCARCSNGPRTGRLPKQSELAAQRGVLVPARTYFLSACRRSQPGYPASRRPRAAANPRRGPQQSIAAAGSLLFPPLFKKTN